MTDNANQRVGTNFEYTGHVWMTKNNMGSVRMNGKDQDDVEYSSWLNFYVAKNAVSSDVKIESENGSLAYVSLKGFLVPNVYTDTKTEKEVRAVRLMVTEFGVFEDNKESRPDYKNKVTQKGYANNIKKHSENFITGYSTISSKEQNGEIKRSGISVNFVKDAIKAVEGMELDDGGSLKTTMTGFLAASKAYEGKPGAPNFVVTEISEIEVAQSNDASKSADNKAPKQKKPTPAPEPDDNGFNDDIPF